MAHSARITSLVEDLVSSVTGSTSEDAGFRKLKTVAARELRSQPYTRTNQFEVRYKYEGLIEKFVVLNREDLAEALESRWKELPDKPTQSQPEVLLLLLLLSDRPAEKTPFQPLQQPQRQDEESVPLTWKQIEEDDPFTDNEVWAVVERGYHSSGDEDTASDQESDAQRTISTQASSAADESENLANLQVVQLDVQAHQALERHVSRLTGTNRINSTVKVSERWMIRNTISMLHGLASNLYYSDAEHDRILPRRSFNLSTLSPSPAYAQLLHFARIGTCIKGLRSWCSQESRGSSGRKHTYINTCQFELQKILNGFDSQLVTLEQRLERPDGSSVVSLGQVFFDVNLQALPFVQLYDRAIKPSLAYTHTSDFVLLNALHDTGCEAQLTGNHPLFHLCADLLVCSTDTYLRSAIAWVREGKVYDADDSFFIREADPNAWSLGSMWSKRHLLKSQHGTDITHAPAFMSSLISRIHTLGKSQAFLQQVNIGADQSLSANIEVAPPVSLATWPELQRFTTDNILIPFSERFDEELEKCLLSREDETHRLLMHAMVENGKIFELPAVLGRVYHSSQGSEVESFSQALVQHLKKKPGRCKDRFYLTRMAQLTLGSGPEIEPSRIAVQVQDEPTVHETSSLMRSFESVSVTYHLPWILQNITHEESPSLDGKVCVLLLQACYAKSVLNRHFHEFRIFRATDSKPSETSLSLRNSIVWFTDLLLSHIGIVTNMARESLQQEMSKAKSLDALAASYKRYQKTLEVNLLLRESFRPLKSAILEILEMAEHTRLQPESGDEGRLERWRSRFTDRITSLTAGLRGIHRAEGEDLLEVFADRLEL